MDISEIEARQDELDLAHAWVVDHDPREFGEYHYKRSAQLDAL